MTAKIRPILADASPPGTAAATAGSARWPAAYQPTALLVTDQRIKAAARAGFNDGERLGYVAGWRYGVLCGLLVGLPIGGAAVWAAIELGRMATGG